MLNLPQPALELIRAAVRGAKSREACGLLLGRAVLGGARVQAVLLTANVAADPARRFSIPPITLLHLHRGLRDAGEGVGVLGPWHSHPYGPAAPSATDVAAAAQGSLWLILEGSGRATAWQRIPDGMRRLALRLTPRATPLPPKTLRVVAACPLG